MMKSNQTCRISALPKYINVSDMADGFTTKKRANEHLSEANTDTTFVLMPRRARIGKQKRREFIGNIQGQCKESPIIETDEEIRINETEFKRYQEGEIVVVGQSRQRGCETRKACSNDGPRACGYGWVDPFNENRGISVHEVTSTSICVHCSRNIKGGGANCDLEKNCLCEDIRSKHDLMRCGNKPISNSHWVQLTPFFRCCKEYSQQYSRKWNLH